jgi:hypothetical protein
MKSEEISFLRVLVLEAFSVVNRNEYSFNCRHFHSFLITQTVLDPDPDPPKAGIRIPYILIRNIASV